MYLGKGTIVLLFSPLKHQSHLSVGKIKHPKQFSLFSVMQVVLASKIAVNIFGRQCIYVYVHIYVCK